MPDVVTFPLEANIQLENNEIELVSGSILLNMIIHRLAVNLTSKYMYVIDFLVCNIQIVSMTTSSLICSFGWHHCKDKALILMIGLLLIVCVSVRFLTDPGGKVGMS